MAIVPPAPDHPSIQSKLKAIQFNSEFKQIAEKKKFHLICIRGDVLSSADGPVSFCLSIQMADLSCEALGPRTFQVDRKALHLHRVLFFFS